MQQPHYTPANAQHVPPGWTFPTLAVQQPAVQQPAVQQPMPGAVTGGGAAAGTVTRVRWGRLLPLFIGLALLGFGLWSVTQDSSPAPRAGQTVSGGGAAEDIDIARAARTDSASDDAASSDKSDEAGAAGAADAPGADATAAAGNEFDKVPASTPPAATTAPARSTSARTTPARTTSARPGVRRPGHRQVRRPVRRGAGIAAARGARAGSAIAATTPGARRVSGGGANASGELPYTGFETWFAAILGLLLLGVGICVHVNAVRIAATAMLYRRGILLRPVDCARLMQDSGGLSRMRILLSNALHRLFEEPSRGDFVGTRLAR